MRRKNNMSGSYKKNQESIKRTKKTQEIPNYQLLEGEEDVLILDGPYSGSKLSGIWKEGNKKGRDWVINSLWVLGDDQINSIIRTLLCN